MNTQFTVTCHKGTEREMSYKINLGQDILDGLSKDEIRTKASQAMVIAVQNSGLRKCDTREEIAKKLRNKYPNVTVSKGAKKEPSLSTKLNELKKILGPKRFAEYMDELLKKHQD
jgi:alcohol dehydrogenase class IV